MVREFPHMLSTVMVFVFGGMCFVYMLCGRYHGKGDAECDNGEMLGEYSSNTSAKSESFRIDASARSIIFVLTSFSRYPEWISDVRECDVYAHVGNVYKVRTVTQVIWWRVVTYLVHTVSDNSMSWNLDPDYPSPMFRHNEGEWRIRDRDGMCDVHYRIEITPTFLFPLKVIDSLKQNATRRAIEWVPRAVYSQSTIAQNAHPFQDQSTESEQWYTRCIRCMYS